MNLRRFRCAWIAIPLLLALGTRVVSGEVSDESSGFFFIHLSDVHACRHASEVADPYGFGPRWLPNALLAYFALEGYEAELVFARGRELFSVFKQIGRPVLGFVRPAGPRRHFPASGPVSDSAIEDASFEIVAAAADARGAFARIFLELDGEPLEIERWGDYFGSTRVPADAAGRLLRLTAERERGAPLHVDCRLPECR
jgi:hypothetical protein